MDGPKVAKNYVSGYLQSDLPTRLAKYRTAWGLDAVHLPGIAKYFTYEPLTMDSWPTIITIITGTTDIKRIDYEQFTGDPVYRVTYAARTYVWVRGDPQEQTVYPNGSQAATSIRDDLTTVVRSALLDHPGLTAGDPTGCLDILVDEGSIREEFSDLTLIKGDRVLAGAYIAYDINMNESVTRDPLGIALTWVVEVDKIVEVPNAPALVFATLGSSSGEADLTWQAPTWSGFGRQVSGYRIEWSNDNGANWTVAIADTGTTQQAYTVTGLTVGQTVIFRAAAINNEGAGIASTASNAILIA